MNILLIMNGEIGSKGIFSRSPLQNNSSHGLLGTPASACPGAAPSLWIGPGGSLAWSMCSAADESPASFAYHYAAGSDPFFVEGVYVEVAWRKRGPSVDVFRNGLQYGSTQPAPERVAWPELYSLGDSFGRDGLGIVLRQGSG